MKRFRSILDLVRAFPDEQSCINYLEQILWKDSVVSPFDTTSKVYKCANNRYKCKNTGKYFNVRTNTIFEGSKIPLQLWFIAIFLYLTQKRGISSYQLAQHLGVTQKSAWFILYRLRYATEHQSFIRTFSGIVECDETFIGGKNKNRHWDKKVPHSQGRSFKDKIPVFGILERESKQVKAIVIPNTQSQIIQPLIYQHIERGSAVMTDEWYAYKGINKGYTHSFVDHYRQQYANGETSTNGIECFWSHLKRSVMGVYYHTSKRHLQLYLNEMVFRYNTKIAKQDKKFDMFLNGIKEKRVTWHSLKNRNEY